MLKSWLWLGGTIALCCGFATPLLAQSITAAPDGTGTVVIIDGNTYHIDGGTQTGTNLFHSFQGFGLSSGEIANFLSHPSITNIFGRVTGGSPSLIDGLIQATPNLYLMNPAGIVFGANAQLNVGGDFFATTADQICFEDGCFNATGANDYSTLFAAPTALGFLNAQPGSLINAGTLEVAKGKSVHLSGGTVINLGEIVADGGNVAIAAVPGERRVRLNQPGSLLSLELTDDVLTDGITPLTLPELLTATSDPISKVITPGNVALGGTLQADTVDLYAAGQVTPSESSTVEGDTRVIRFSETGENPDQAVFIDRRADDPEMLLYGAAAGTVSQIIEPDENGIAVTGEQLTEISAAVGKQQSVAIVAEGNQGSFWLGSQWIRSDNIGEYQDQLQQWGEALTANADILLYSCFTALGATGEALIASIASLTGADVAASVDVTGSTNYEGNWELEASTGTIEAGNPFTSETIAGWDGKLATLTVNSAADDTITDGSLTLREALNAANGDITVEGQTGSGTDTIIFDTSGVFSSAQTITTVIGSFSVTDDLVIEGTGQSQLTIDGNSSNVVFKINTNDVTIKDLTIQNGSTTGTGGGISFDSTGSLILNAVTVSNNTASTNGGGINSSGSISLINSQVSENTASLIGGGIRATGSVTLNNSNVTGNYSGGSGGGISADSVTLTNNSTVSSNQTAGSYGGVRGVNSVVVDSSTIANNIAGGNNAGVVSSGGSVTVTNSTISANTAGGSNAGVGALGDVTVSNSTVTNNVAGGNGGGVVSTNGDVSITSSQITSNRSGGGGAGVESGGEINLTSSTVSGNSAGASGGGLNGDGEITVTSSTISSNTSADGGGIKVQNGPLIVTNSTISGNVATDAGGGTPSGGGILSQDAVVTLINSTVSGNSTGDAGGGIHIDTANVTLINSTIAFNTAISGGGLSITNPQDNAIANTIIAQNTASGTGADISANLSSSTVQHSLIQSTAGITGLTLTDGVNGNVIGKDPKLGPLQNNGGSTATHALAADSPAINAGNNALAVDTSNATLTTDQTGNLRIVGSTVDIGAYEFQTVTTVVPPTCDLNCTTEPPIDPPEITEPDEGTSLIDSGAEEAEGQITSDYADLTGDEDVEQLTIAQTQKILRDIGQQTGVKPALIYFTFLPSAIAQQTVTPSDQLIASLSSDLFALDTAQANTQNEQDQLQLILVTPYGDPIVKRTAGLTRGIVVSQIRRFRRGVNAVNSQRYLQPAQQLYDWLIRPLQPDLQALGIDNLSIIAAEGLRSLPVAALHDGEQFLIENYSVGLVPSLSLIDWRYSPLTDANVLAMGASQFATQTPLPAVPVELELIAQQKSTQAFLNSDFTYANLQAATEQRQFQILHLATHATFRAGAADDAYIQLWGRDDLQLKDLRTLELYEEPPVELLVLSACQTALGDASAELGFAGASLQAGVKSVLASLWQVSDLGTVALMAEFYQALDNPEITTKADALRSAQLALLQGDMTLDQELVLPPELAQYANTNLTHPYYWSAFTLVGSPW